MPNSDQKREVRLYENGRGSTRITRRFDRKMDVDAFEIEKKEQQKKKKTDPFVGIVVTDRNFEEEPQYWLEGGRFRFAESYGKRMGGFKEIFPKFGKLTLNKLTRTFGAIPKG